MLESMTGFARSQLRLGGRSLSMELRSVNSKYLEVRTHLPRYYSDYESKIAAFLKRNFGRGNIDVSFNDEEDILSKKKSMIDPQKAKEFYVQAKRLKKSLKLDGEIDVNVVLQNREIFSHADRSYSRVAWPVVSRLMKSATAKLKKMRKKEGSHLEKDIRNRLDRISSMVSRVDKLRESTRSDIMERLKRKIADISVDVDFDAGRLEQEVVLYAVRADISEEITRLESHIKRMKEFFRTRGQTGRKLDFLVQEMNREVNTIGSKAGSGEISRHVVDIKSEIEKIREQIQNIE